MQKMDIKIEMMDAGKESGLLFFEEKIERFIKEYKMKKANMAIRSTVKKKV
jgi:hypothetical protein